MTDIIVTYDGELDVAGVQAQTDAGVDFVDAFMPADARVVVADSGRLVLPGATVPEFVAAARGVDLNVEEARQW